MGEVVDSRRDDDEAINKTHSFSEGEQRSEDTDLCADLRIFLDSRENWEKRG